MPRLDDVCAITMGQSPDSSTYNKERNGLPFFQGNADFGEIHPSVRMWCSEPSKIARENDILISVRAPIGALNIANCECCIGRGLAALTVNNDICTREYLWYALSSKIDELNSKGTGSTFKAVNKSTLSETEIPLPPLDEQRHIAATLDKVTDLISKRRQQLDKLDELVKARFVEMFGDPATNPMGWERGTIRDVVTEVKYGTSKPAVEGGTYKYLRMGNITYDGHLDLTDLKYIDIPDSELDKCAVKKGDVLFNRTNSKELVGKTCVYNLDETMVIAGYIIRVRVNNRVLPEYLSAVLNSSYGKKTLAEMCKAIVGQANINAQELQNIQILIPPIELQHKFLNVLRYTEKISLPINQSCDKLETLKKALMQEYFG